MIIGINHRAIPSETLIVSDALVNCARSRNTVIRFLTSNMYVYISDFILLEYLPIPAAIFSFYSKSATCQVDNTFCGEPNFEENCQLGETFLF